MIRRLRMIVRRVRSRSREEGRGREIIEIWVEVLLTWMLQSLRLDRGDDCKYLQLISKEQALQQFALARLNIDQGLRSADLYLACVDLCCISSTGALA